MATIGARLLAMTTTESAARPSSRSRARGVVAGAVMTGLLVVLSACSGTTGGTPSVDRAAAIAAPVTVTAPAIATTVEQVTTTVAPPAPVTSTVTTTAAPPPAPVIVTHTEVTTAAPVDSGGGSRRFAVEGVVSPSGNITCGVVGGVLYCTIGVYDFDLPSCPYSSSGALVSLAPTGPSDISACGADMLDGIDASTLDYGDVAALGNYACTVEEVGMACLSPGGYGFTIARAGFQPF